MRRSLYDVLAATVAHAPDKVALIEGRLQLSYRELAARITGLADRLRDDGVRRGDRVVVCAGNRAETVTGFWAALAVGGVAVVINHEQRPERVRYVLADCAATAVLALAPMARALIEVGLPDSVRTVLPVGTRDTVFSGNRGADPGAGVAGTGVMAEPPDVISEDLAALVYTSGSTGAAKGVMLSHANMLTALDSLNEYLCNGPDDVFLCPVPLAFDYGLYQMIMAFSQRATLVLERDLSLPLQLVKDIARHRCTVLPGVPVLFELLERFSRFGLPDVSSVRRITNTGAALLPRHIAALRRLFPGADIYSMYGVTECKRCTYLPPELLDRKPGSVGIAIPNTEILVVDEHDRPCPPYQVGHLVVRGGTVMRGYWGLPAETALKIREHPVRGGRCLYTGDYGYLDADGHFYFKGRMDEVIKVRGRKLIPRDIEDVLRGVPGVTEASVVCAELDDGGHDIAAFVAAAPPKATGTGTAGTGTAGTAAVDVPALRAACRAGLETYQLPTRFVVLPALPHNANGKVDKAELLRRHPRPAPAAGPALPVGTPC